MRLFSQRNAPAQDTYRYSIDQRVRNRLFQTLRLCLADQQHITIDTLVEEMRDKLLQKYGGFRGSMYEAARVSNHPVVEHFSKCSDEEVMDFLQMCFETNWNCGGQPTVDAINKVLDEEGIGYQLTPIREEPCESSGQYGAMFRRATAYRIIPPTVIRRDEQRMHAQVIEPCLSALSDSRFATASAELMNAFEEYRKGQFGDAVTDAGAAIESVLKTICTEKRWAYDKDRATIKDLIDVCRDKQLFYPFYAPILVSTGTIRNKIGDAHGKGPAPEFVATKELADHMIYTCCTNIVLLVTLAKLG